jgi:hypothetical protein
MRQLSTSEVIGYFWIFLILAFGAALWWTVNGFLHREDVCVLQAGFECVDKDLFSSGGELKATLVVRNQLGRWIMVKGFLCSSEVPDPSTGRPNRVFEQLSVNSLPNSVFEVSGTCHRSPAEDPSGPFRGIVYLQYEFRDEPHTPGTQVVLGNVRGNPR